MKDLAYYRVTISAPPAGTAPSDGFIDPQQANDYLSFDQETGVLSGWPSSSTTALAKARANVRWEIVKEQLGLILNVLSVSNIAIDGATIDTAPSDIEFTVVYERPSYVAIPDSLNPGTTLTGADAVARFVENAFVASRTLTTEILNPTIESSPQTAYFQTILLDVGPIATSLSSIAGKYVTAEQISYTDISVGNYRSL